MKTDVITVTGRQAEEVLRLVDKTAVYKELSERNALRLRLLAEETLGMMRAITGERRAEFWLEDKDGVFEMHLRMYTPMDEHKKEQLLAASRSGVNEATRTLMGKIRAFFEPDGEVPLLLRAEVMADAPPEMYDSMMWSMENYREELYARREETGGDAAKAWDELEKSVVSHVADDIRVFIRGNTAEMTIIMKIA